MIMGIDDTDQIALHGYAFLADVILSRVGNTAGDLRIGFSGTDDEIIVRNMLSDSSSAIRADQIEQIVFDDSHGLVCRICSELRCWLRKQRQANDAVYGTNYARYDYLAAQAVIFFQVATAPTSMNFTLGDGKDIIDDNGAIWIQTRLQFMAMTHPGDVSLGQRSPTPVICELVSAGTDDEIVVRNTLSNNNNAVFV